MLEQERFSAFGETKSPSKLIPWGYRSKRHVYDLVFFGRRLYDPDTGRWLSPDPKGFIDGPNLYQFLLNNPLLHVDLYGEHVGTRIWNAVWNPRVQGGLQAVGGLTEAAIGAGMTYITGGIAGPVGWVVMAHGLDHALTGCRALVTGEFADSATTQLLEKAGMSHNMATCTDSVMSLGGSIAGIAALRNAARASFPAFRMPKDTFTTNGGLQQSITKSPVANGGRNRFIPDPSATGAHTVFRRDPTTGLITHYETFQFQTNVYDPKIWESVKRFDALGESHYNKILQDFIDVPHIHDPKTPGKIRPAEIFEIPKFNGDL